ncbi:MAG: TonB-dependent receptor [Chitinophagales bacterium]|nr:TonB-dependent receptor [Chitinophagales bacterium]
MIDNIAVLKKVIFLIIFCIPVVAFGQTATISGKITDESGEGLIGASIYLEGTTIGGITDIDGNYKIGGIKAGNQLVVFSYLGFSTVKESITFAEGQTITKNITMAEDILMLNEAIVVGYGSTEVKDLTGSVTSISSDRFQTGNVTTPEQLVVGKIPGVKITSNSGMPGAGSKIRIRGGTSLNASNDPLIVIDGVPLDNDGIDGAGNALSLVNPDDIDNISVLKDASAAAIYGSRAANGVIIITTKKGKAIDEKKVRVGFSTSNGVSMITNYIDVMDGDQFRDLVNAYGTATEASRLGTENTDWQKEIYQLGFTTDNDLTITGGIKGLPYRVSLEYFHENGILKRATLDRVGGSVNLSPSFFKDHLKVNVNAKYFNTQNFFANQDAIGAATNFDPTQPVFSGDESFGGYFEWTTGSNPNPLAARNPLGLIEQKDDESSVNRFIGNIELDYRFHFLPELRANLNLGTDIARSKGSILIPETAASNFTNDGLATKFEHEKDNRLIEFYLNYRKELNAINSKIDLTGGYSFQEWESFKPAFPELNALGDTTKPAGVNPTQAANALMSFFGRANLGYKEKYLLTVTLRNDGSSRFSPDTRWGLFPSVAFAWNVSQEPWLKGSAGLSYLKFRLGWGVVGQQDINNDYPYIANYSEGDLTAQYQFGDTFYTVMRPDGFDGNIKWEETSSYNAGVDFGIWNNRVNGAVDIYYKKTEDLIGDIPVPAGSNFTNRILTNVGTLENKGIEFNIGVMVIDKDNTTLEIGFNGTANKNKITRLTKIQDPDDPGILVGGINGGVGNNIQIQSVGFPINSFYLYEQLYDEDGNPIEGAYADINGDSVVNANDFRQIENPDPDFYAGLFVAFTHKKWNAGLSMRGDFGNYVYNNINSDRANYNTVGGVNTLYNATTNFYETEFIDPQYFSDIYLENASYVRLDNLYVGYNFGRVANDLMNLRISAIMNNVLVISGYSGLDPEVPDGIDKRIFPRPRTFIVQLNLDF